jgi:hypothetical protein
MTKLVICPTVASVYVPVLPHQVTLTLTISSDLPLNDMIIQLII